MNEKNSTAVIMNDYDSLDPDGFSSIIPESLLAIQWKLFAVIFLTFLILNSDVFIDRVLVQFDNAVDYKFPTSWGVLIQGTLLITSGLIGDLLIRQQVI